MAIESAGWWTSVDLIDGTGKITTITRRLRAADATEATAAGVAFRTSLAAVTDSTIVGYTVGEKFSETALGALPAVTVLNSVTASITAAILDQPTKFANTVIPAPKIGVFSSTTGRGANVVNPTATIVVNYLTEYTEAGSVFISDGESLDPVFNASGERVTRYRRLGKNS